MALPKWTDERTQQLVDFVGEVTLPVKNELLGGAKALIFPINWPEPFGLVMIEAMACGTPTIAFNRGSVPEVLEDGRTGYIVENIDEAVSSLGKIDDFDRGSCREIFEQRYSVEKMVISAQQAPVSPQQEAVISFSYFSSKFI